MCAELDRVTNFIRDAASRFENVSHVNRELEEEKSGLFRDINEAEAQVRDLRKSEAAVVARAEVAKAKVAALKAEVDAAEHRETEVIALQGEVVRAVVEKLLRSRMFYALSNELASIISSSVVITTLDAVA